MKDLKNDLKTLVAIKPQALSGTTDIVGEVIDRQGYDSVMFSLLTDAIAASSLAALLLIEESDASGSGFAAVADADLVGVESDTAITNASDTVATKVGYKGTKRYVRATLDITANNGTDVVAAIAVLGHAHAKPVA